MRTTEWWLFAKVGFDTLNHGCHVRFGCIADMLGEIVLSVNRGVAYLVHRTR